MRYRETAAVHQLIELDRVEELLRTAESFPGGNGLVVNVSGFTRSILKFSSLSAGEVFGYVQSSRPPMPQWFTEPSLLNSCSGPVRIGSMLSTSARW